MLLTFVLLAVVGGLLTAGLVLPAAAGVSAMTSGTTQIFEDLPDELEPGPLSQQSRIYDRDNKLLATFYAENRIVVGLDEISMNLQNAVVATEDKRFYAHGGVDMEGMARAALINMATKKTQGASTLTQQYVKNVLIEQAVRDGDPLGQLEASEDTMERKLREAKLAIALEKKMSKLEILERYLNIAQFGTQVYGAESASRYYFNKSAKDLSIVEAATIAGITKAPGKYDPTTYPENTTARRNIVLKLMYEEGYISKEEHDAARTTPIEDTLQITPTENSCAAASYSAYFCDYVTKVIISDPIFGETEAERKDLLYRGGLDIYTTLDSKLQREAYIQARDTVPLKDPTGIADAIVSVVPGTGEIRVMAQNRKYVARADEQGKGKTSINFSTDQVHGGSQGFPAGSTFKPFVLAEWIKSGRSLTESVSANKRKWQGDDWDEWTASCIENFSQGRGDWEPGNSDGFGTGQKTVLQATASSINTAYISMLSQLDLCKVGETAEEIGFRPSRIADEGKVTIEPSMVLGVQNTSPLAMAAAYATFASGGTYCDPVAITRVTDANGADLGVPSANCRTVLESDVASGVNHALEGVLTKGGASGSKLAGGRVAAGKTGTSQLNQHTWFIGYTPQLSTATWIGHPDRNVSMQRITINGTYRPIVYGSTLAAPMWKRFMDYALADEPNEKFPDVAKDVLEGEKVTVPALWGVSVAEAEEILEEAGFRPTVRSGAVNANSPAGRVAYTYPAGTAPRGSQITIYVSNGQPPTAPSDGDSDDNKDDKKDKKKKKNRGSDD
ncbi:carboxypeptidase [Flavimobilis marinus]|nr:carboxypeptidase [Flavimobilis marinus]